MQIIYNKKIQDMRIKMQDVVILFKIIHTKCIDNNNTIMKICKFIMHKKLLSAT